MKYALSVLVLLAVGLVFYQIYTMCPGEALRAPLSQNNKILMYDSCLNNMGDRVHLLSRRAGSDLEQIGDLGCYLIAHKKGHGHV
jgi:hypothetical protein